MAHSPSCPDGGEFGLIIPQCIINVTKRALELLEDAHPAVDLSPLFLRNWHGHVYGRNDLHDGRGS
jgi:hypothetical protein